MVKLIRRFLGAEEGASMLEYGLMVALIAVVCVTAVTALGVAMKTVFNDLAASL
jgi:pilus assembly protein Flp/PilA